LADESALIEEFYGGESSLGIFISLTFQETFVGVLMAQLKDRTLSDEENLAWFTNPWIMLDVRLCFAQILKDIAAFTKYLQKISFDGREWMRILLISYVMGISLRFGRVRRGNTSVRRGKTSEREEITAHGKGRIFSRSALKGGMKRK
jgi:hypothetical protein